MPLLTSVLSWSWRCISWATIGTPDKRTSELTGKPAHTHAGLTSSYRHLASRRSSTRASRRSGLRRSFDTSVLDCQSMTAGGQSSCGGSHLQLCVAAYVCGGENNRHIPCGPGGLKINTNHHHHTSRLALGTVWRRQG